MPWLTGHPKQEEESGGEEWKLIKNTKEEGRRLVGETENKLLVSVKGIWFHSSFSLVSLHPHHLSPVITLTWIWFWIFFFISPSSLFCLSCSRLSEAKTTGQQVIKRTSPSGGRNRRRIIEPKTSVTFPAEWKTISFPPLASLKKRPENMLLENCLERAAFPHLLWSLIFLIHFSLVCFSYIMQQRSEKDREGKRAKTGAGKKE